MDDPGSLRAGVPSRTKARTSSDRLLPERHHRQARGRRGGQKCHPCARSSHVSVLICPAVVPSDVCRSARPCLVPPST